MSACVNLQLFIDHQNCDVIDHALFLLLRSFVPQIRWTSLPYDVRKTDFGYRAGTSSIGRKGKDSGTI
jgi:hypothetical protein